QLGAGQSTTDPFTTGSPDRTASQLVTVTINGTNDAPVMTAASPSLTGITEDQTNASGTLVSTLLGGTASDVDTGAVQGIAISGSSDGRRAGKDAGNGAWPYTD